MTQDQKIIRAKVGLLDLGDVCNGANELIVTVLAAVAQHERGLSGSRTPRLRPAASLTHTGGALEPHPPADLRPVDRIKLSHLRFDRHPLPPFRRDDRSLASRQ